MTKDLFICPCTCENKYVYNSNILINYIIFKSFPKIINATEVHHYAQSEEVARGVITKSLLRSDLEDALVIGTVIVVVRKYKLRHKVHNARRCIYIYIYRA